jgi:hypothetical protein
LELFVLVRRKQVSNFFVVKFKHRDLDHEVDARSTFA